ncbi:MAG TPA: hybrid-cluster NAD(P)-dependent oxidoreductase [Polyangia bacterium]
MRNNSVRRYLMSFTGEIAGNDGLDGLPLHIFLWIAGRAGAISPREVSVFLRMLDHSGWCQSKWARENLYRTHERYAASWNVEALSRMSRDLEALQIGLRCLREIVPLAEAALIRVDLVRLAEATARASAGLLGHAALRREQRDALLVFTALTEAFLLAADDRVRAQSSQLAAVPAAPMRREGSGPHLQSIPLHTKGRLPVRCVQVIDETVDVKTFRFAPLSSARLAHLPGQFVTIEIVNGNETMKRSYTIASSPTRHNVIEITVKRVPDGRVSNWLHDNLKIGDELTISGPHGAFGCESVPTSDKLLFISGGSGITPVMSMSRYLYDVADPRDIVFLHSARTERDLIFRGELELIAARHPRFRPVITLTHAGSPAWKGLTGRISEMLIDDAVPDFRDRTVFLCGPTPFMEAVRLALIAAEFPMANFHAESFGGARVPAAPKAEAPVVAPSNDVAAAPEPPSERKMRTSRLLGILPRPRLVLVAPAQRSDRGAELPVDAGAAADHATADHQATAAVVFSTSGREASGCTTETILEAAEGLGLPIPSACRVGVCGTCKTRKLSGNVSMDCEDGLDASDRSDGFILACTARPLDRVTVEA